MKDLFTDKFVYHIYPLGMCNCPKRNDFCCPAGNSFEVLAGELDRLKKLGVNAILIGPVFESTSHGYDTVDYYYVDRRLGNNEKFATFCRECHKKGFSVILDAVFNHTGRDFFAFKDLIKNGASSKYTDWYVNLNFSGRSCYGDCFDYEGWSGCKDLVKLNVDNPEVRRHLFGAVEKWIDLFDIDGLRLDAANVLSGSFMDGLSECCKSKKKDFWLMGEVVHDDYNKWAHEGRIDSVTNYQIYKSMWSALNEKNMFELSYNLNREFNSSDGMYRNIPLFNFLDNHDVNRIASTLNNSGLLKAIYGIMFTIPGIPSVYYGSESGIRGKRGQYDDYELRTTVPPFVQSYADFARPEIDSNELSDFIAKLADIRMKNKVLQNGMYKELFVKQEQLAFARFTDNEMMVILVNGASDMTECFFYDNNIPKGKYINLVNNQEVNLENGKGISVNPESIMILKKE